MPSYDPQRSRHRPQVPDEGPAPVDALLEPAEIHLPDADIEIDESGEDVIVHTDTADVEVLPEAEALIVRSGDEELVVDLAAQPWPEPVAGSRRNLAIVAFVVAALVALVVVLRRRRR